MKGLKTVQIKRTKRTHKEKSPIYKTITAKFRDINDKEKFYRIYEKKHITYRRMWLRLTLDFSPAKLDLRSQWSKTKQSNHIESNQELQF